MTNVSLLCSLYAWKGDEARILKTLQWYDALCEGAGHPFRLLLVDDCSDESFDGIIPNITTPKGFCTEVQYFKSDKRLGKAVQLNRLLSSCNEDYIGIVDNDIILPYGWLMKCIVLASQGGVGICGVMVEDLHVMEHMRHKCGIDFFVPGLLGGACLVWKSGKLGKQEYFWAGCGVYAHEDAEFVKRIGATVGGIICLPEKGYSIVHPEDNKEYTKWKRSHANKTVPLIKKRFNLP